MKVSDVLRQLNRDGWAAVTAAFAAPEVKEAMARQGNTISIGTPEAAVQYFRSELAKYAVLVKKAGVELQ